MSERVPESATRRLRADSSLQMLQLVAGFTSQTLHVYINIGMYLYIIIFYFLTQCVYMYTRYVRIGLAVVRSRFHG